SLDAQGRIIALNFYHPIHGCVTLTTADPFPEEHRYVPGAVRMYRKSLAALAGFGVYFIQPIEAIESRLLEDAIPQHRLTFADSGGAVVTTWAERGGAVQQWQVKGVWAPWG